MYDYHNHTLFSDDSVAPMEDMIESAIEKNFDEIAITDHYDPDYPDDTMPSFMDFKGYQEALLSNEKKYSGKIKLIKGIEIGIQGGETLKKCREAANDFPYDFIIGSYHCAMNATLDGREYHKNRDDVTAVRDYYKNAYQCLKDYKDYDVLGHINVIDRYVNKIPSADNYMDLVEKIIRLLIVDGKGMEINTSSFRYGMGERTTPTEEMLKLYIDLGGEIITTGSDAHRPDDVGDMIGYAQEMILRTGHKYVATFHGRKLIQVKI